MNKPHKHCEVIKAWAAGQTIQFRPKDSTTEHAWITLPADSVNFTLGYNYRIKPEPVKTVGYRRWVFRATSTANAVGICSEHDTKAVDVETCPVFVQWIDKEWQYHVVNQD